MDIGVHILFIILSILFCVLHAIRIDADILQAFFFITLGTLWAALEVQIEGEHGWAAELPTSKFFNTKYTWYHAIMNLMVVVITFQTTAWSWRLPFWIGGLFLIEDYLWFLINPYFGIYNYKEEQVPWHTWGLCGCGTCMPQGNWLSAIIMASTATCSQLIEEDFTLWWHLLAIFGYLVFATLFNMFMICIQPTDDF